MDTKRLQFNFFIALLLIATVWTAALFWPFIDALALSFMTAVIIRPVYQYLLRAFNGRRTVAALAAVAFVIIVVLVPLAFLTFEAISQAVSFFSGIQQGSGPNAANALLSYIAQPIQAMLPNISTDASGSASSITSLFASAKNVFSFTITFALDLFLAIVALFYMLRDGRQFRKAIIELSPLSDSYDEAIIVKIERAVNSVVRGSLFVALIRGILTAVGFAFFGVPHPIFWGAVTAIVSLLPSIGMLITLVPAVVYLWMTSSIGAAIGLAIWGIVIISFIDNIVQPIIMGKGFQVHPLFVLISVLGGLIFFGPVGLLLGPLVLALFSALLEIYKLLIIADKSESAGDLLR
ncbi:MAG: AI-2E family transporter [Patescibacteria group bacterium]|nr:AI-2E family transporter [Patescibacteria group bacterium]MDE2116803.1 AI-2E family transporter [Patescibacteria group bacterium]